MARRGTSAHPLRYREQQKAAIEADLKAAYPAIQAQVLAGVRERLGDAVAERFTYLAQHSSAPTAWHAALQEFNVLLEDLTQGGD